MGLFSVVHANLIPTILVGLIPKTGVKSGVIDMPIVYGLPLYMQKIN